ncbi:hypothetical protein [Brachybacterium hainanense]|uniref:DUF3618 domain-containing protein n=1 Tax=Brachybacterium hainanense TaxID=1541174 RepID=A0ABV6RAL3_9MICO
MSKGKKTTLEDMGREAERRQDNLASDIDELVDRLNPKNALVRWKNEAISAAKGFSGAGDDQDARGRLAVVAGGVIGVAVLVAGVVVVAAVRGRSARDDAADGPAAG